MAVKAFKFGSPGIFLNEIDQSQISQEPGPVGPIIVGRSERGPAMRPVTVQSYEEFVQVFGEPVVGGDSSGDVWRSGIPSGPTYGAYAAQAWLANNPTVTFVRLLGTQADNPTVASTNNQGYAGWTVGTPSSTSNSGAYGLFVFPSSSQANAGLTGSLAAVWYCNGSFPVLSGTIYGTSSTTSSNALMIESDSNGIFTVGIGGTSGEGVDTETYKQFNFSSTSDKFIRKIFNTNPQNTNRESTSGLSATSKSFYGYWLGETFENELSYNVINYNGSLPLDGLNGVLTKSVGIILPVKFESRLNKPASENNSARTGWIIGQTNFGVVSGFQAKNQKRLFRFIALDYGDWTRNNLKVTINNIVAPQNEAQKFGTFDVELRRVYDTDANKILVESYTNCNLDPDSPNYIARKIGDTYYSWDETNRILSATGDNPNNSKFIRVEIAPDYTPIAGDIPFGVLGPLKYESTSFTIGSTANASGFVYGTSSCRAGTGSINNFTASAATAGGQTFQFTYPNLRTRVSSSEDSLPTYKLADWGATTTRSPNSTLYNQDVNDILRLPLTGTSWTEGNEGGGLSYSWAFSLDDVRVTGSVLSGSTWQNKYFVWTNASKGTSGINGSYTAVSGTYINLLNTEGINSFTTTFQGGIDGFNILEGEPLRNSALSTNSTDQTSYIYNTYRRAIDTVRDPEFVEGNLFTIPGLAYEPLTLYATQMAESRGDVLAIIDASGPADNLASYITKQEKSDNAQGTTSRVASVSDVVTRMQARNLNTSYGATYYPWVQISDSVTGKIVPIPPSIVALGAMSYNDSVQAPWFAPAGFNRGGLSTGNAGVNVVNIVKKLTSAERDQLYPVNVNPIASFPNEGIVIFGQKTLQATPSALDRINVRRLMLYIKRGIGLISTSILFEPNVQDTWNNFKDQAEPFLADVKARFGLTDYRLILDETTTTPDLIDQNILYAKIFLKPARAIEFIAVDFFITKSGASFNI